jgi:putative heme-binding domain-containing protein
MAELDTQRLRDLAGHPDPQVRQLAARFLSQTQTVSRHDVLEKYVAALSLTGNPVSGKRTFNATCAACHRAEGVGHEIGPNLAAIKNRGTEAILLNVLDPNREVNPQFVNYVVMTTDGRTLTGLIAGETAAGITLTRAESLSDTIAREDIDAMWSTGQSIMPEGLENEIDLQAMADLIAYLMSIE